MSVYIPPPAETNIKKLTAAISQLAQGRTNSNGIVTLNANNTKTTVQFVATSATTCIVHWQPASANAAAQMATLFLASTDVTKGQFILTHASNTSTDQTFNFEVRG